MRGVNVKHESERARSVHLFSGHSFHPRLRAALAAAVILAFSTPIFAQAAKSKKPAAAPQPKSEREQANEQVFDRLAQAWAAVFSGKNQEAIALAEPVAKLSDPDYKWAAVEAAHLQARAYHQSGTAQGRARAVQLWKQIERLDTSKATKARLQIAKALEAEARGTAIPAGGSPRSADPAVPAGAAGPKLSGDPSAIKQAIDTLEPLLKAGRWNLVEVEAALDLSRLYVQANRFDDAKKTLDYIVAYLGVKKNLIVLEIPPGLEKPYIAAAKAALAHLKYDKNIGLAEFEAAEKLRKAGKFAEAARAYQAVIAIVKNFPESDYAPRSDLHIGDCLMGLGQTAAAMAHWKKFIAPAPAGAWRGQAYIGIIDYCLEEQLDLPEAGKYADLARSSLPVALRSPECKAGWQLAAFDIHLRVGLVSFCQGNSAQAVAAFQAAKAATTNKATAESLDALIAAAKSGKAVIPEDCRGMGVSPMSPTAVPAVSSSDKPALALSMGIIHLLAGRYDNADNMFDRVLGTDASRSPIRNPQSAIRNQLPPLGGSSPAQLAFAAFGRGAVLHAQRKPAPAKDLFLASIKAFPAGTWHDETLYRLATITQDEADAKFGKADEPAKDTPKQEIRDPQSAIRNQERLAAFIKAKGAALPYWQEIISRYPKSPRCEQAFYNAGVLLCELAEAADAPGLRSSESEKKWKDAAFMLGRFTEFYPKSPFAGDAYIREIDIALERMFDLDLARQLSAAVVEWAKAPPNPRVEASVPGLESWRATVKRIGPTELRPVVFEAYLRAGLVAYLDRRYEAAQKFFESAQPLTPPRDFVVVEGRIPTGIECIIAASRDKRALTPKEAMEGDGNARLLLQIADIYHKAGATDKAVVLYDLLLSDSRLSGEPMQCSWAHYQRAGAIYAIRDFLRAKEDYLLAQKVCPAAPWAARSLLYAGTTTYNFETNADAASEIYRTLVRLYPASSVAPRACYFLARHLEESGRIDEAKTTYREFLKRHTGSQWAEFMTKKLKALEDAEASRKKKTTERNG